MKRKVSDYIADFLVRNQIQYIFSVVGGGAMHLNDAFGHQPALKVVYQHHEQACSMAADACARITGLPAAVCVTTGPGATNAITGVMGAYIDSIPMLVFSGQVRYATSVYAAALPLRTRGVQEFDIIGSVGNMTKYCETVKEPGRIRYALEKALYMTREGRPGPCWLDIPLDVQAAVVEEDDLPGFTPDTVADCTIDREMLRQVMHKLTQAKRPLVLAGNGIRIGGAHQVFLDFVHLMKIPVVTTASSVDAIATDDPCYVGRTGMTGDRAGNFAVQNCDCLLSIGSRLSYSQTGFYTKAWARAAYKIAVDVDAAELQKDTVGADRPVCADALSFLTAFTELAQALPCDDWRTQCAMWKKQYPVVTSRHYTHDIANTYAFFEQLTKRLTANDDLLVSCGTARVIGSQAAVITEGMRFITNVSAASMGFDLPAAVGVSVANRGRRTVLVTGDGSLQMNLQELQTIVHHRFPILIFVINNAGYHSIRQTQNAYFHPPLVGVGPDSGDLSFPDLAKISAAYGLPYERIQNCDELPAKLEQLLQSPLPAVCEVMVGAQQRTEPKVASKQTANGQMVSLPLEDMAPFLPREELRQNMYIPLMEASEWKE